MGGLMETDKLIKVLFLVMYSGEGDYEKSIESAKNQIGIEPHFFEAKNLPMQDAHCAIYSYWNDHKDEYDMFVKLDADFVLATQTKVIDVWNAIKNTKLAVLCVWTHDFLRNRHAPGMIFGNKHCTFNIENVKAKAQFDTGIYIIEPGYIFDDITLGHSLAPAAFHGHYSLPIQLFAQGVKRRIRGQWDIHQIVVQEFNTNPEVLRFIFLIGWELGADILSEQYNYTDPLFKQYFDKTMSVLNNSNNIDFQTILNKILTT